MVGHSGVPALPLAHHVDAVRVADEGECVTAVGGPKVDGRHDKVALMTVGGGGRCGEGGTTGVAMG